MTFETQSPDKEFRIENTVLLNNGLACVQSAFVELSPKCPGMFVMWFSELHAKGYIKVKTARVVPKRDWIKI